MRERFSVQVKGRGLVMLALWLLVIPFRWVTGAVTAAVIHELGHLLALWISDVPVHGMEIDVGGALIRTGPMEPIEELCCALAGPAAGALVCLFWRRFPEAAVGAGGQTLFNLIPVYPLDGGRAWAAARNISCKPGEKGVQ